MVRQPLNPGREVQSLEHYLLSVQQRCHVLVEAAFPVNSRRESKSSPAIADFDGSGSASNAYKPQRRTIRWGRAIRTNGSSDPRFLLGRGRDRTLIATIIRQDWLQLIRKSTVDLMPDDAVKIDRVAQRRAQILGAATRIFSEKGYEATSIADIASDLRIGHGTFYRYFQNKQDIFRNVVDRALAEVAKVVAEEDPQATQDIESYHGQVARLGQALYQLVIDQPHTARLLFYEGLRLSDDVAAQIREGIALCALFTANYLQNGVDKGFLRDDLDVETTAKAINAMIFEGVRGVLLHEDQRADCAQRWIGAVQSLMFHGVAVPLPQTAA